MKYSIGLDIGIASVGWSIIRDDTGYIQDLGVKIFSAQESTENQTRREARGARRRLSRRTTRLADAKKILNAAGFFEDKGLMNACPYTLRVKGLTEQLTAAEIYKVILHIVKKRGISYLEEDEEEVKKTGKAYQEALSCNQALLKEQTPGQIQLDRLQTVGRVRTGTNENNEYQLNTFTVSSYANELRRILEQQQAYHPAITTELIDAFVKKGIGEDAGLVYRKRPYYHGPGNAANHSPYGRWKDGTPKPNIFDELIGVDITGEKRASNLSVSAQKFNLLNDLNNLTFKNRTHEKITTEEKEKVLNALMSGDIAKFGPKDLAKLLDVKFDDISGWRIDKNEKPQLHKLEGFRKWQTVFEENGLNIHDYDTGMLDDIAEVITLNTSKDAVEDTLQIKFSDNTLPQELHDTIVAHFAKLKVKQSNQAWHAFSLTLLRKLNKELLNTSEEQNTILERLGLKGDVRNKYADYTKLPIDQITAGIYNPTVVKSVRQAVGVLNSLVQKYGKENIGYVTIEMPREKNTEDEKKIISNIQKKNEDRKQQSEKYFLKQSGWSEARFEAEKRKPAFLKKLYYYYEQDGRCAYSGRAIQPDDLLKGETEIDHIIPLSISYDDSIKNKVLVFASANQEKGQRTPYQAYRENANLGQTWETYKAWVTQQYKGDKHKRKILLEERDIFDPNVQKDFIARNLNDTRYASRVVLNVVQSFFYQQKETKIRVINGAVTHTLRKRWQDGLDKKRETHHHHAVDASLCAVYPFVKITPYEYKQHPETGRAVMIDIETGEWIDYSDYKRLRATDRRSYEPKWSDFIEKLTPANIDHRIKFAHQVDRKSNRQISDATIYSTRERDIVGKKKTTKETVVIAKTPDIYTVDGFKKFQAESEKHNLLMETLDEQTYALLCQIARDYPHKEEKILADGTVKTIDASPFKVYCDKEGLPGIRKYSKKGNGPIIRRVKYYDKALGRQYVNITKSITGESIEQTANGRKVVLKQLVPWRTDVYFDRTTNRYCLLGVKQNHLRFVNGQYGIPRDIYEQLKADEKITDTHEFCFSLYKKSRVKFVKSGEVLDGLWHAKNESGPNQFQLKPINREKWVDGQELPILGKVNKGIQLVRTMPSNVQFFKVITDDLGACTEISRENLLNIID